MKQGKIIPNGVSLEKHENDTVIYFTNLGYNIELIPTSHIPHHHTPDFKMLNEEWEAKSPKSAKKSTLEHTFQDALKQSPNIIIDLRRIKDNYYGTTARIEKIFRNSKRAQKLKIITKSGKLLEFQK